ncbi:hypothetical protein [Nitrospirillum sp. BR 11163]|uniref:hypothetical protein n=1 Tax=Nitrospirillum sp. BR 11163 TaxID=3104323 RepID=UPI002AFFE8B7|nr:hypothetical protein [Nitrospirillum sp. BR 11163]MEA1673308.1 hypothetical protein [Nitrospirillum sp. BR 11163]
MPLAPDISAEEARICVEENKVKESLSMWTRGAIWHKYGGFVAHMIAAACTLVAGGIQEPAYIRLSFAALSAALTAGIQFLHPYTTYRQFMAGWRYLERNYSEFRIISEPTNADLQKLVKARADAEAMLVETWGEPPNK